MESDVEGAEEAVDEIAGVLFRYHPKKKLVAFESLDIRQQLQGSSSLSPPLQGYLIFIGGMTDGLIACPYVPSLSSSIRSLGWRCVQVELSSSRLGFGVSSLLEDVEELDCLVKALQTRYKQEELVARQQPTDGVGSRPACSAFPKIVLMGHSTGCQDAVYYLQHGRYKASVCGVILQAPVSDREASTLDVEQSGREKYLAQALALVANGQGEEMLPRATLFAPICAERYVSLEKRLGDDDMFSSDLTDRELKQQMGHSQHSSALLLCSAKDEYVPPSVYGDDAMAFFKRLAEGLRVSKPCLNSIDNSNNCHNNNTALALDSMQHCAAYRELFQYECTSTSSSTASPPLSSSASTSCPSCAVHCIVLKEANHNLSNCKASQSICVNVVLSYLATL